MRSTLTELLRYKDNRTGILRAGDEYLVAQGDEPVRQVEIPIDHADFLDKLALLRYGEPSGSSREDVLNELSGIVTALLATDRHQLNPEMQYDLVANPVELSALPFELACDVNGRPLFAQADSVIVLTRRVRHGFDGQATPWWVKPRVLFAVASPPGVGDPVPAEEHDKALRSALRPWIEPLAGFPQAAPDARSVLTKLTSASRRTISEACQKAVDDGRPYTHVHLLAHGIKVGSKHREHFGVALHTTEKGETVDPVDADGLAAALAPALGTLSVVTLAVCDSANQANTIASGGNLAHTLHSLGVPVVVASQFPLTFPGSILLVQCFYESLLKGADVRRALHRARTELYDKQREIGHDWASLIGYVQIPEDYDSQRIHVSLESQMAALRTAQAWSDHLVSHEIREREPYERVAGQLRDRIGDLLDLMEKEGGTAAAGIENFGLLGSAQKRLAELCFERGQACGDVDEAGREAMDALLQARTHYEMGTTASLSSHWTSVQRLSLEAVLTGEISRVGRWYVALEAAHDDEDSVWVSGSLAEIYLLAPLAGRGSMLAEAELALVQLKKRVRDDPFPLESTARQLRRYVRWWTKENGFFGDRAEDLSNDSAHLLEILEDSQGRDVPEPG